MQPSDHENPRSAEIAERAIILELLRDDHDERWSRAELQAAIDPIEPALLRKLLDDLERHGIIEFVEDCVVASRCARHIDELDLIGV